MSARLPLVRLGAALLLATLATLAPAARAQTPADPASAAPPVEAAPTLGAQPALVAPPTAPAYAPAATQPSLVRVPDAAKPAHEPLAKRWWFWTSLGGAAVAVVLIGLFFGPTKPYSGNATPGVEQVF